MALGTDWKQVELRLEQLSGRPGLLPTVYAMKRIMHILQKDPALAGTQRGLSHAALRLGYAGIAPFVLVGWGDKEGYTVSIWEPSGDVRDRCVVTEGDVPDVVNRYLSDLREPG